MVLRDLWVDFNALDERDQVQTLAEYAEPDAPLFVGSTLIVGDDDGNSAKAHVLEVRADGCVTVQVHRATFAPAEADSLVVLDQPIPADIRG